MENISLTSDPILLFIGIILIFMATYTSVDLFTLMKSSERNNRFLFLGAVFSMSIGIWILNFLMIYSQHTEGLTSYNIPLAILSILIGLTFTGIAFYNLIREKVTTFQLIISSLFFTLAVFCIYVLGIYTLNFGLSLSPIILIISCLLIAISFYMPLWILYSKNLSTNRQGWFRPLSSLIITGGITEGYFLLTKTSALYPSSVIGQTQDDFHHSLLFYIALFVSIIILTGLIISSTLVNKRLEKSDSNLKDISAALDASSIVAITDPRGIITYVNEKFVEISKHEESELIGQNHRILNSGYHSKEFFKELWRTIGQGHVWKGEIRNRAKDGTIYWVNTTIVPFLNKKGKPYQYVSIRTDITNRKLAEENLKQTLKELEDVKFALDHSSIVAITDQRGRITSVNDKFCEISKYSRDELIGQDHRLLNSGYHTREFFQVLWRTIASGAIWKGELRNKAKDGTFYWLDTTIVPFMNEEGKPYQYLAIRNDITERKRTEEIINRQDKLAAIGQLAAGVAHEIRNPLTSMKGYAEFLTLDEKDEARREYLDIILDEIERVDSIVEDFMVLAKPKPELMEVKNIVPVMKNVLSLLEFEAKKQKININFEYREALMKVVIDENRMKQVLLNFIKNAVEAMPNGGTINVSAFLEDQQVHLSIADTGVGIPEEKLKKIGEPFFTTKETGNGLGLMISFKIIDSHNGKVYVESELNKGTTFHILLPHHSD
ncbi:PAS domain S-box-containing protein [Salirhabdus euzebyi]|uniref:histidine kinase n=2 Tax=Salirhabdus euzebyi TaxID=394506 RepID=A0A841PXS5_9BACI|nr:PAS domain S-box protein [Salirhabdus euzebyi]MBB6452306.1 PAS domain S-box-containing protein [Salirhabdus euzebyi]